LIAGARIEKQWTGLLGKKMNQLSVCLRFFMAFVRAIKSMFLT
jgi:hypothetical protein